jgi:small subunit ribosomal protein S16
MIKLRLKRFGKKFEASYRIVAMNNDTRRDGRPLEELGFYNPRTDEIKLDVPATVKRLQQGAQPTRTVRRLLEKANVYEQAAGTTPVATKTASPAETAAPAATAP